MTLTSMIVAVTSAWGENPWAFGLVTLGVAGLIKLFVEDMFHKNPTSLDHQYPGEGSQK